jgi:hypothetical protein
VAKDDGRQTIEEFEDAVNRTPKELEEWLQTDESKSVGQGDGESKGRECNKLTRSYIYSNDVGSKEGARVVTRSGSRLVDLLRLGSEKPDVRRLSPACAWVSSPSSAPPGVAHQRRPAYSNLTSSTRSASSSKITRAACRTVGDAWVMVDLAYTVGTLEDEPSPTLDA